MWLGKASENIGTSLTFLYPISILIKDGLGNYMNILSACYDNTIGLFTSSKKEEVAPKKTTTYRPPEKTGGYLPNMNGFNPSEIEDVSSQINSTSTAVKEESSSEDSWFSKAWDVISSTASDSVDAVSNCVSNSVDAIGDAVLTKGVYRFASAVGTGVKDVWESLETTGENLINGEFREAGYSFIVDLPFNFVSATSKSAGIVGASLLDNTMTVGAYFLTGDALSLGVAALTGDTITQHALNITGNLTGLESFNRFANWLDNPILNTFNFNESYDYLAGKSEALPEGSNFSFSDYYYDNYIEEGVS